jgi:hypothetical protein
LTCLCFFNQFIRPIYTIFELLLLLLQQKKISEYTDAARIEQQEEEVSVSVENKLLIQEEASGTVTAWLQIFLLSGQPWRDWDSLMMLLTSLRMSRT